MKESVRALPPEKGILGQPRHAIMLTLDNEQGLFASRKIFYFSGILLGLRIKRQFKILRRVMKEVR